MPKLALLRTFWHPALRSAHRQAVFRSLTSAPPSASAVVHGKRPKNQGQDDVTSVASDVNPPTNPHARVDLVQCLLDQGIPSEDSHYIVTHLPNHHIQLQAVYRTLNCLNSLQLGQERLTLLLRTHPALVLTAADRINKCYVNLSSIFSQNYVYKVLLNSPNVVDQKRSELADKINYLNTLGIPNSHIVNSSVLSYPLSRIKVRSEFLKRCGILRKSTKRDGVMTLVDLSDMFDSADVHFATKVAKLTPIEFEAFTNLYKMEEDPDSEAESDTD